MKKEKTSIQISTKTRNLLKTFCEKFGYKMSGFLDNLILERMKNETQNNEVKEKRLDR